MSTEASRSGISRARFVLEASQVFVTAMGPTLKLADLENFAQKVEARAHAASAQATRELMAGTEGQLTEHAANVRSISAHIMLLKNGCVPALKIDKDSPTIFIMAVEAMAYLNSSLQAMENGIY